MTKSEIKLFGKSIDIYYILCIILMIIFLIFIIWLMRTSYRDMANNLFAEAIGIIITIVLLIIFVDIKEQWKWNNVKHLVYDALGSEIYDIYTDISNLCDIETALFVGDEDHDLAYERTLYKDLNKLIIKDNIIFTDSGKKILLNYGYGELFIHRKDRLKELELKYFKFLEPSIIKSLMVIQQKLYSVDLNMKIKRRGGMWFENDEGFFDLIKSRLVDIFKEIHSLHYESGLKIYF